MRDGTKVWADFQLKLKIERSADASQGCHSPDTFSPFKYKQSVQTDTVTNRQNHFACGLVSVNSFRDRLIDLLSGHCPLFTDDFLPKGRS